jgi:type II secretory ATPase GspE/PulE/Tfp pilus assembly ATPase PilB-like protein
MGAKDSFMGRLLGNADKFTDKQVAETLALLVRHGIERSASDIHIEPHERFVLVRYRIDGALRGVHKLPRASLSTVMAQLKSLAGMHAEDATTPQEGEYSMEAGDKTAQISVTTMPVYGGEKAVLHLTLEHSQTNSLQELGFWGEGLDTLQTILANPHGLVTVAGPRHSGISSTLFSMLQALNSPMASIATIESGPRHRLPGVAQTYLANGMSTLEGLQATLKQDPNVVMVDNLPDGPTAELALHAAATGHTILAGLHADSAITAALRLRHIGTEPFLLASALRASIGQRLVRKLCPDCRERYTLTDEEREAIESSFGISSTAARKRIHELEQASAPTIFGDVKQLSSTPTHIAYAWRPKESGCDNCEHTGYQGRTAVVEVLRNTEALHKALLSRDVVSANVLQVALIKEGFIPMALDGLVKALRGQTTIAEVLRVSAS